MTYQLPTYANQTLSQNYQIIQQKPSYTGNLIIQLIFDNHFDLYTINIFQINTSENIFMFGIFTDLTHAQQYYNYIKI